MNKKKKLFLFSCLLLLIAIVYTFLVKYVDVSNIAPDGSKVGFATVNSSFKEMVGLKMGWYKFTKYLGLVPIAMCGCYALLGLYQLFKNKGFKGVDKRIYALGVFYIVFALVYFFFEKVALNYRPFIIDGELEASFPSTHTLLAVCICGSSLMVAKYFIKNEKILKATNIITWLVMLLIVVGRTLSGVHWLTDIIGGIIISLFMLSALYTVINIINGLERKKTKND
ncbi:MAG: phosphatase PAP2 family protein [Bacilli bacterium]|nr:phosphatase PAP2 family protein [Bacilli bacterium]